MTVATEQRTTNAAPFSGLPARLLFRAELSLRQVLLPFRIRDADMSQILAMIEPGRSRAYSGLDSAYILRRVRKALRRPVLMPTQPCLREGLLAYWFLRKAGFRPDLVFGVEPESLDGPSPAAHCWIRLDGKDVFNPPDREMTVVLTHPGAKPARTS